MVRAKKLLRCRAPKPFRCKCPRDARLYPCWDSPPTNTPNPNLKLGVGNLLPFLRRGFFLLMFRVRVVLSIEAGTAVVSAIYSASEELYQIPNWNINCPN